MKGVEFHPNKFKPQEKQLWLESKTNTRLFEWQGPQISNRGRYCIKAEHRQSLKHTFLLHIV